MYRAVPYQWHDKLRARRQIAGYVPREGIDIIDAQCLALFHRRAADAPSHRDANACRLALEGSQYQRIAMQEIKSRPIQVRNGGEDQGRDIGGIGDHVALSRQEPLQLLRQLVIKFADVRMRNGGGSEHSSSLPVPPGYLEDFCKHRSGGDAGCREMATDRSQRTDPSPILSQPFVQNLVEMRAKKKRPVSSYGPAMVLLLPMLSPFRNGGSLSKRLLMPTIRRVDLDGPISGRS